MANPPKPGNYGILIRHDGFVNRYVRVQPHPYYPESDINAYPTSDPDRMWRFGTQSDAEAKARELATLFGLDRYRFDVIECRMVEKWFLVEPTWERERNPVG